MSLKSLISESVDYQADLSFPLPSGKRIIFTLKYLPRTLFRNFTQSCQGMEYDPISKRPVQKTDNEKLLRKVLQSTLVGWKNFTYEDLPSLIPVDLNALKKEASKAGGLSEEIPFDSQNSEHLDFAIGLLNASYSLESWLMDEVMNISNFQLVPPDEQIKNSDSSPDSN
jgi:hypothetical protein